MKTKMMNELTGAAALAVLIAGLGPVALQAQEEEDERRERAASVYLSSAMGGGGFLGVGIEDVDDEQASELGMRRAYGVHITSVSEDSPASEGGIEEGDVLVGWNGDRLESVAQLRRLLSETPPGRTADITVFRGGREVDLAVEVGSRWGSAAAMMGRLGSGEPWVRITGPDGQFGPERLEALRWDHDSTRDEMEEMGDRIRATFLMRPRLGVSLQGLGEQLADYFGVEEGALVTSVSEDSPAEAGGLMAGDVIVGIGDEDVSDAGDVRELVSELDAGDVEVHVVRDGRDVTVTVELEEMEEGRRFRWRSGDNGLGYSFPRAGQNRMRLRFSPGPAPAVRVRPTVQVIGTPAPVVRVRPAATVVRVTAPARAARVQARAAAVQARAEAVQSRAEAIQARAAAVQTRLAARALRSARAATRMRV